MRTQIMLSVALTLQMPLFWGQPPSTCTSADMCAAILEMAPKLRPQTSSAAVYYPPSTVLRMRADAMDAYDAALAKFLAVADCLVDEPAERNKDR